MDLTSAHMITIGIERLMEIAPEISKSKGFLQPGTPNADPIYHIALTHGELSEAMEALRLPEMPMSEKIPGFTLLEEELADVLIRTIIIAHILKARLHLAVIAKSDYNEGRPMMHGGKRF